MNIKELGLPWRAEWTHPTPGICFINHEGGHKQGSVAVMYCADLGTASERAARHLVKAANTHELLVAFAKQIRELSANAPGREWAGKMADEVLAAVEPA